VRSFKTTLCLLGLTFLVACGGEDSASTPVPIVTPPPEIDPLAWDEATPESVGMSAVKLQEAADAALLEGTFGQAFVVVRNGKIIFEQYRGITEQEAQVVANASPILSSSDILERYGTRDKNSLATSWSVAKSFTSALFGVALEQGSLISTDETVGLYLGDWAVDGRSSVTFQEVLDMRSGLTPVCFNAQTSLLEECTGAAANGGDLVRADDQLTPCIERPLARQGETYGWWDGGRTPYPGRTFLYSNCDTMVLGKVLSDGQAGDFFDWAEENLFAKIGMEAFWWKDNSQAGAGNILSYCCIDAIPRDFARLGQLFLNRGSFAGDQVASRAYFEAIASASLVPGAFYKSQFWFLDTPSGRKFISALGFDGQMVAVDIERDIIVVRMGLYEPILNGSSDRIMRLRLEDPSSTNWVGSLPQGQAAQYFASYNSSAVLDLVSQSVLLE
jgi:CubicO group peptidase (beta-lactamase class C family)